MYKTGGIWFCRNFCLNSWCTYRKRIKKINFTKKKKKTNKNLRRMHCFSFNHNVYAQPHSGLSRSILRRHIAAFMSCHSRMCVIHRAMRHYPVWCKSPQSFVVLVERWTLILLQWHENKPPNLVIILHAVSSVVTPNLFFFFSKHFMCSLPAWITSSSELVFLFLYLRENSLLL